MTTPSDFGIQTGRPTSDRPLWPGIVGAIAVTVTAMTLCWLLRPLLGSGVFAIALASTTLCALLFGSGAASVATVLTAVELWDLFTPLPLHLQVPTPVQTLQVLAYLLSATGIIAITKARQEALRRTEAVNAELAAANAGLQLAVSSRDRVLAVVSHDLKSPLNAILLSADLLKTAAGKDTQTVERIGSTIQASAQRMDALVRDLLDLSVIERGVFSLNRRPRPVSEILDQTLLLMRPQAAHKGITLLTNVPADLPPVDVDCSRLRQAEANLIGNAIKFTPAGGTVAIEAHALSPAEVQFCVRDSGPGIAVEALPHLFDRTWMAHHVSQQGTGLGLSIAKAVVEAHGGRIWAENNADVGATFCFTVPTVPPAVSGSAAAA